MMLKKRSYEAGHAHAGRFIFTGTVIAQDLPPGVLLLSRVKNHINEELQRLGSITCLETVQREHQPANGKMRPLDTVHLEVLTNVTRNLSHLPVTGSSRRTTR
jgi:hypothetical protein